MTTVSQIITDAYQYNNIVALSAIPNADEQAKALRYLNRIFSSIFGNELGEQLTSWEVGQKPSSDQCDEFANRLYPPYQASHNTRLVCNLTAAATVYLPPYPQDGERFGVQDVAQNFSTANLSLIGNGRKIEGLSTLVLTVNGTNSEWFFRADLGNWVKLTELALDDDFPLPNEFEEYFITLLALRLGSSEDIDLNNQLTFVLKEATRKLRSRYRQKKFITSELGLRRGLSNLDRYSYSGRFNNG